MSKGHVLVVEDNLDNYELVRTILEIAGYDSFLAVNGRDGVEAARKQKPDLILMDMALPEMNGWDATKRIRDDPQTAHIPMVALTAHTLPRDGSVLWMRVWTHIYPNLSMHINSSSWSKALWKILKGG